MSEPAQQDDLDAPASNIEPDAKKSTRRTTVILPVIIQLTDYDIDLHRGTGIRVNSQADVIVYTGDNPFWNLLGKGWIRLMSWLSCAF